MLRPDQKTTLLEAARSALTRAVGGDVASASLSRDEGLLAPRGVFVTLHAGGSLRGCVGVVQPRDSLIECVAACAVSAAIEDARFEPVTVSELLAIRIEISVLSPAWRIAAPAEIRIGVDGVIVAVGGRRGLLLPQVAAQQGWTGEEFVAAACRKAGLGRSAWETEGATLHAFTAEVFQEGS